MLDGLVFSFKIPQRQLGDLEVFWGGIGRGLTKRVGICASKTLISNYAVAFAV